MDQDITRPCSCARGRLQKCCIDKYAAVVVYTHRLEGKFDRRTAMEMSFPRSRSRVCLLEANLSVGHGSGKPIDIRYKEPKSRDT
jgi:hypothetical protein